MEKKKKDYHKTFKHSEPGITLAFYTLFKLCNSPERKGHFSYFTDKKTEAQRG
jgi:hypothetical protein